MTSVPPGWPWAAAERAVRSNESLLAALAMPSAAALSAVRRDKDKCAIFLPFSPISHLLCVVHERPDRNTELAADTGNSPAVARRPTGDHDLALSVEADRVATLRMERAEE